VHKYPVPDPVLYQKLLLAYEHCLKNKRHVKKSRFHLNHESWIHGLALDIQNNRYKPGMSTIFVVTKPKPREVVAASLRDRVVHHFIYDYMAPYWEKRFVSQSYACRKGKGPLQAGRDLEAFFLRHERSGGAPLWYLQVDVQSFFPSIDLNILYEIIARHLTNPLYLDLCREIIFHRPSRKGAFRITSPKSFWNRLPRYKSLFAAPDHLGLGIGNLTSQFFANIYMNEADQYIVHHLKHRFLHYQRYVDDLCFFHSDPNQLRILSREVETFLNMRLRLKLNPKKTLLQPLARGLDHLGFLYKPRYRLVRHRVVQSCKDAVKEALKLETAGPHDMHRVRSQINSYMGHFSYARSSRLKLHVAQRLGKSPLLAKKMAFDPRCSMYKLLPDEEGDALRKSREEDLKASCIRAILHSEGQEKLQTLRLEIDEHGVHHLGGWVPIEDLMEAGRAHFAGDSPTPGTAVP
jgi:RNA-directed DNA polymerase